MPKKSSKNSKMECLNLLNEQEILMNNLESLHERISGYHNPKKELLEQRLKQLEDVYNKLRENHLRIINQRSMDEDMDLLDSYNDQQFAKNEEMYNDLVDVIYSLMSTDEVNPQKNCQAAKSDNKSNIRFPEISLPKFNGNIENWLHFRNLFESIVIKDAQLTDFERLHYLQSSLSGEALVLADSAVDVSDFQTIWGMLQDRYNNERQLVDAFINSLLSFPEVASDFLSNLKKLRDTILTAMAGLRNLGRPVQYWDDWLVPVIFSKLDKVSKEKWNSKICVSKRFPTYSEILDFLDNRIQVLATNVKKPAFKQGSQHLTSSSKPTMHVHQNSTSTGASLPKSGNTASNKSKGNSNNLKCYFCQNPHSISQCDSFKAISLNDRMSFTQNSKPKLCINCLGKHDFANCKSSHKCLFCGKSHHSLLHRDSSETSDSSAQDGASNNFAVHLSAQKNKSSIVLATAQVLVQGPDGRTVLARAIIDPCSECCIISENLVQTIRLTKKRTAATISGVNNATTGQALSCVAFSVKPKQTNSNSIKVRAFVLPRVTAYRPPQIVRANLPYCFQKLEFADPCMDSVDRIDLLLGADVYGLLMLNELKSENSSALYAQLTIFGWILTGPLPSVHHTEHTIHVHHAEVDESLDTTLKQFWEIESVPSYSILSSSELDCENHFKKTHIRLKNGVYQLELPFQADPSTIGSSWELAQKSLFSIERKFARNLDLFRKYSDFMKEYISMSHMTLVGPISSHYVNQTFLPHHPVIRQESLTTKLRVVFNGSAKGSNGISLNDCLHTGQALQSDILAIITRWRLHRYVLTGDVEKMFRQIEISPKDRKFQCILWRFSTSDPVQIYELNTITYGLRSSPFQANRVVKQLCMDEKNRFPNAARCIENNVYVDDVFFGGDDIDETRKLRNEIIQLMNSAHLPLRKWASNVPDLIEDLGSEPHKLAIDLPFLDTNTLHILGVQWNPSKDQFQYEFKLGSFCPTKRTLLSTVSKLYDPLGWISPILIRAKIILQSLWLLKIGWDDPLPKEVQDQWISLHKSLKSVKTIAVPRYTFYSSQSVCELHGFSDASVSAYGAVVYLKVQNGLRVFVSILVSKTRVAPLKTVSIPRLELCAASLLTDLICYVKRVLNMSSTLTYCWTDSTIVLSWLKKPPSTWKTFVANRISHIQVSLPKAIWKHVPTADNPADLASRGIDAESLVLSKLWWKGPIWLVESSESWPTQVFSVCETDMEERKLNVSTHITVQTNSEHFIHLLISRNSSWVRILRVLSIMIRSVSIMRGKSSATNFLTAQELNSSRDIILKYVQNKFFSVEIQALTNGKISKSSKLFNLTPFLDKQGILRLGGRLEKIHREMPAIVPSGEVAILIIRQAHINLLHSGVKLTLYIIRTKYWIINARSLVKRIIHDCVICARNRPRLMTQLMGQIPLPRVQCSRIFSHSGLDYAGPFSILNSIGRGSKTHKVWIVIFVCFSVKAVFLDFVNDCSTQAFLNAFRRFAGQCGVPSDLYSDNATTFKGAERELKSFLRKLQADPEVKNYFANEGINWHFLPPGSPHFGGLWEAGVKSLKSYLKPQLSKKNFTVDEFRTFLSEIQALLNSRPIAPLHDDVESYDALTPGHFIIGDVFKTVPTPSVLNLAQNRLQLWQFRQRAVETFWRKWQRDYIMSLQTRSKWFSSQPNLVRGDFVLIKNELLPPSKWELGRIVECHPGSDGLVRTVSVKTACSLYKRPIVKLVKLPVS